MAPHRSIASTVVVRLDSRCSERHVNNSPDQGVEAAKQTRIVQRILQLTELFRALSMSLAAKSLVTKKSQQIRPRGVLIMTSLMKKNLQTISIMNCSGLQSSPAEWSQRRRAPRIFTRRVEPNAGAAELSSCAYSNRSQDLSEFSTCITTTNMPICLYPHSWRRERNKRETIDRSHR